MYINVQKMNVIKKIFTLKPYEDSVNLGIQKPHKLLGYVPQDNLSLVINEKGWNNIIVNTNLHGIRESNITKKRFQFNFECWR